MRDRLTHLLLSPQFRGNALLATLWLVIVAALFAVREVLLPFLLAIFLAYLLQPLVRRVRRVQIKGRTLPPALATVSLYILFVVVMTLIFRLTFPQVARELVKLGTLSTSTIVQLRSQAPKWPERIAGTLNRLEIPVRFVWGVDHNDEAPPDPAPEWPAQVDAITGSPSLGNGTASATARHQSPHAQLAAAKAPSTFDIDLKAEIEGYVRELANWLSHGVSLAVRHTQSLIRNLFGFVFKTFLVLMMTAFILADTERISRFLFSIVPIDDREAFDQLLGRIDRGLSGVVRGQVIICLVNGSLTLVGMLILGIPLAFLLAGLATLLSLIPIFGSILSTVPIVIIALTQSLSLALLGVSWVILVHLLESNLLNPKIMGDAAKIHPVIVILALLVGEHFYGLVGALFAVPIASIVLTLFRFVHAHALELQARGREPSPSPGPSQS